MKKKILLLQRAGEKGLSLAEKEKNGDKGSREGLEGNIWEAWRRMIKEKLVHIIMGYFYILKL